MNSISVKQLSKKYEDFQLSDISFDVPMGTIMGLIGENGAGKTTIIKSMLNLINVESGDVKIFDKDYKKDEKIIKEDIGVVLGEAFFSPMIDANHVDKIMMKINRNWDTKLFYSYLQQFDLPKNKKIKDLSKGMKMKLQIATALARDPKLLILDEPTSGLDPIVRNEILDIFLDFIQDEQHTVLLSTHITTDLEKIADYITFVNKGKLIFSKDKDEIMESFGILKCDEETFQVLDTEDIIRYKKQKYSYEVLIEDRDRIQKKYNGIMIDKPTIDEIMMLYIKGKE